jgi:hypothetical protein
MNEDYTMNASLCRGTTRINNMLSREGSSSKMTMTMKVGNVLVFEYNTRRFTRRSK